MALVGAVRAQPDRGPRRSRVHGPFDGILAAYLVRNLADPDAQLRAFRGCCGRARRWRARVLGARLPDRHRGVERGVRDDHHSGRPAAQRRRALYTYLRRSVNEFDGAA